MKERPGVMLYFDNKDCFDALSDEETGRLIKGLLSYALTGREPQFDGALMLVWLMLKPRIDYDASRYYKLCRQKSYAVYCREQDKKQLPKQSFSEWETASSQTDDIECYPTTTTTATTTPTTITTATATTAATTTTTSTPTAAATLLSTPAAKEKRGHFGLNRTVRLTDGDYLELMDELGVSNLNETLLFAEPKAKELGCDADTLDWKSFLRRCWYQEVRQRTEAEKRRA